MTYSRYFQVSLLWPIIASFIFIVLNYSRPAEISFFNELYGYIQLFLPYIVYATILYFWFEKTSGKQLYFSVAISPIIWGVFYPIFISLDALIVTDIKVTELLNNGFTGFGFIFLWSTLIAYGFVGLVGLIFFFIKRGLLPNKTIKPAQ